MNKKLIWGIVIVVSLIVVIDITATNLMRKTPVCSSNDVSCMDKQMNLVTSPLEISDWNPYANTKDGYSISYPNSYHVAFEHDLYNFDENKYEMGNSKGVKIQVNKILDTSDVADSVAVVKYSGKVKGDEAGVGMFDTYDVFASNNKAYYKILVMGAENDSSNVTKILKTFKFYASASASTNPLIVSIQPTSGPVGTIVTVTGKNLGSSSITSVAITNTSNNLSVLSVSPTMVTFKIPEGLPIGPHGITIYTSEKYTPHSNKVVFTVTAPTSSLKIYKNLKYGFEITYPAGYKIMMPAQGEMTTATANAGTVLIVSEKNISDVASIEVHPLTSSVKNLQEYLNLLPKTDQNGKVIRKFVEKTTFASQEAYVYQTYEWQVDKHVMDWDSQIYFQYRNNIYEVRAEMRNDEAISKIISTLKFTN